MATTQRSGRFLCGFGVTDHFLLRQWERKISDEELMPILIDLEKRFISDGLVIVPIETCDKSHNTLFIKLKDKNLITCFISNLSEYRGKNLREQYILSNQKLRQSYLNK